MIGRGNARRLSSLICAVVVFPCCILLAVFGWGACAYAEQSDSIVVYRKFVASDVVTNREYGFVSYETDEGDVAYSVDVDTIPSKSSQELIRLDETDSGLLYLLQNGYPEKNLTGNNELDFVITQAAIWLYYNGPESMDPAFSSFDNPLDIYDVVPDWIWPLYQQAVHADENETTEVGIILSSENGLSFSVSDDGKTLRSERVVVDVSRAGTYSIGVPEGQDVAVYDDYGNPRTVGYKSGEGFFIEMPNKNPILGNSVGVSISYSVPTASVYRIPSDENTERMVCLQDREYVYPEEVVFSNSTPIGSLVASIQPIVLVVCILGIFVACVGVLRRALGSNRS